MNNEICPACKNVAMTRLSKVVAIKRLKCNSCGKNLRLAKPAAIAALLATAACGLLLAISFGIKGYVAFAIAGMLIFMPASYFIDLEVRE